MLKPVLCSTAMLKGAGHDAVPAVTAQVTLVQFSPVTAGSLITVPGALLGPKLATVTV